MLQGVLKATASRVLRPDIIFSKIPFFFSVISEFKSLDINIRNSSYINVFKKELLKFIRPEPNSTYNINDNQGIKITYKIVTWTQPFRWSQAQSQLSRLCILNVLLQSGYWNNSTLPPSLSKSSLCKKQPLSKDTSSNRNHLKAVIQQL